MSGDCWVASDEEFDFGRKLNKVSRIVLEAGPDGISKKELTRRTQRMLSGTRERDDVLVTLEERGVLVFRVTNITKNRRSFHFLAAEFAPEEAMENARRSHREREEEKENARIRAEMAKVFMNDNRLIGAWGQKNFFL